jgi:hypothetical protein
MCATHNDVEYAIEHDFHYTVSAVLGKRSYVAGSIAGKFARAKLVDHMHKDVIILDALFASCLKVIGSQQYLSTQEVNAASSLTPQ